MPAASPTVTARWVAGQRARLARTRPSTPDGDVERERLLYRDLRGHVALPLGRRSTIAVRTGFVDSEVAGAIGHGIDQVVLLGSGYDGRPLRFGGGATRWFEVDVPSTQADKRRRLAALGTEPGAVTYIGHDLTTGDLGTALDAGGHDSSRPTLFVCEDLFGHLTLEATAALCRTVRERAPAGTVLAATFPVSPEAGNLGTALRHAADLFRRAVGEARRQYLRPGDPEKLMVVTGWRVVRSQAGAPSRVDAGAHVLLVACEPGSP